PYDADRSNAVLVKHADESLGLYLHLSPGIPVAAGDAVQRRQLIGRSGHSGAGSREHLHFCVHRFDAEGEPESVPILFGPPRSRGFVPRTGRFYGPELVPTENLRIRAAGATADSDRPAPLAAGASVQLKVELRKNGAWRDVTRDPATRYEPLTLWNLKHAGAGRLVAEPTEGFAGMEIAEPLASLLVLYEQDGFRERGKVTFTIE
ncbi:MAG: M23 family metallopeptidase, partial [Myxococcales bacterium]|nr:M23 family metallopeptidase [Myxococcales bacterium]